MSNTRKQTRRPKVGSSGCSASEWARGYFCAVAMLVKDNYQEGCHGTEVRSLFQGGGDWRLADAEDIETFRLHGLISQNDKHSNSHPDKIS